MTEQQAAHDDRAPDVWAFLWGEASDDVRIRCIDEFFLVPGIRAALLDIEWLLPEPFEARLHDGLVALSNGATSLARACERASWMLAWLDAHRAQLPFASMRIELIRFGDDPGDDVTFGQRDWRRG